MANRVYSTIQLNKCNHTAQNRFIEIFDELESIKETGLEYLDIYPTNQEVVDVDFMEEFIGPRIAKVSEYMGTEVIISSHWISPNRFFEILCEELREWDEDLVASMTYEDEFYIFAGCYVYKDGLMDHREESGGWFKKELDNSGGDPSDFQDYVSDKVAVWVEELC